MGMFGIFRLQHRLEIDKQFDIGVFDLTAGYWCIGYYIRLNQFALMSGQRETVSGEPLNCLLIGRCGSWTRRRKKLTV